MRVYRVYSSLRLAAWLEPDPSRALTLKNVRFTAAITFDGCVRIAAMVASWPSVSSGRVVLWSKRCTYWFC